MLSTTPGWRRGRSAWPKEEPWKRRSIKFSELFKQLGLPDDPVIDQFITSHSPSRVM
jgi:hypothetical protein